MPRWRNWYTHYLEVVAGAIPWRFESSPGHQKQLSKFGWLFLFLDAIVLLGLSNNFFMLNIPIVLGSVRQNRQSYGYAKLLQQQIIKLGYQSTLVDFKELPLPFFDSPNVPVAMKGIYPYENVQKWSQIARTADAFVLISPEYNHGYTAVLKNALDWLYMEFEKKPFGLVGVSDGRMGGVRSIEQLRPVIENFGAVAIRETLLFNVAEQVIDGQCNLVDSTSEGKINRFLNALSWWANALRNARDNK